jgi:RecA-family ATPase
MDIESFLRDNIPVKWICNPICAEGALGFVAGLPEAYKTWVLIDLAIECARGGGLWLGLYPVSSAKVLFIDQERSKSESQRRLRSVMVGKHIEPKTLKDTLFIKCGTTIRLDLDESFNAFKRLLADMRPTLVLVDSFATFHQSDENDRMTIQKVMERVKELRQEFGCAIVFVDHENKSAYSDKDMGIAPSAGRMAGSVGKVAAAEFVLTVRRYDPETCVVYHTKSTMGERVKPFAVHVTDIDGGVKVWGENVQS